MNEKTTFLTKALTLLFVMLFSLTGTGAQQSMTVYDSSSNTSQYVPAYWYYFDEYTRSQFIIPATDLSAMSGATVTEMRFYTNSTTTYTSPTCKVYVKEVNSTNFGNSSNNVSFQGTAEEDCVYEGTLTNKNANGSNGYVTIVFETPYTYKGGNLLVSIENTEKGTYRSISFYGKSSNSGNRTAVYGNNSSSLSSLTSGTAVRFIPATTFYYSFHAPTNVTASDIEPNSATISWSGDTDSYNLRYWEGFYESFNNGLNGWTIHTNGGNMEGHEGWFLFNGMAAAYSWNPNTYVAIDADNWLISPAVELGGTLEFDVYTVSNYPDSYAVLLSITGTDTGNFTTTLQAMATATSGHVTIDLSAYEGQTGYIAFHHVSNDCWYLDIDNFTIRKSDIVTKPNVSSPYNLEGLDPETSYGVQVQSIYAGGSSDVWEWAGTTFSTLPKHDVVFNTPLTIPYGNGTSGTPYTLTTGTSGTVDVETDGSISSVSVTGNSQIASVSRSIITPLAVGTTAITVTSTEGTTYLAGNGTITVNVTAPEGVTTAPSGEYTETYKIPASGYGTYCSQYPIDFTRSFLNGETAYTVKEKTETLVRLHLISETSIKGGVGFVVKGEPGTTVTFRFTNSDYVPTPNMLFGTTAPTYIEYEAAYGMKNGGFHLNNAGVVPAHRAFIPNGSAGSVKALTLEFEEEDPTGIEEFKFEDDSNSVIYNLSGQRIQKMQRGINIVNGKKIMVK